jgi:DNA-binding beta-propeller fold protein YncE
MRLSRAAVLASCATLIMSFGLALTPAAAITGPATAYPLIHKLAGVTTQARMIYAHGDLFVANGHGGSDVLVFSPTGTLVHDITGEPGATGMVLSPDGGTLYVAQSASNKISAINTTTFAHTEFTVDGCPTYLALVSGRLFYSFGCSPGDNHSAVSSIDPIAGGTPVPALTALYAPPMLAGAGSTLAAAVVGLSPTPLSTYTSDDTGALTDLASIRAADDIRDLAISADGNTLYSADPGGGQFTDYDVATLDTAAEFTGTHYATAVALSPDGADLVGGFDAYDGLVSLYKTATVTPVWSRLGTTALPASWRTNEQDDAMLGGSLTFSSNNANVYGLATAEGQSGVYLFSSTVAPTKTSLHVVVSGAPYGQPMTATATAIAGARIAFTVTNGNGTRSLGAVTANSHGVAKLKFRSNYSGSVQATYDGSAAHLPVFTTHTFKSASRSRLTLTGAYATRHGVKLFRSIKDVKAPGSVMPVVFDRPVTASLDFKRGGAWHVASTLTLTLSQTGGMLLILRQASVGLLFRFTATFKGDSFNSGSKAVSKTFEIT